MSIEYQRLLRNKELMINTISSRGPALPIQLAKVINVSTLFASAYLSELYSEKKVLMSHLKVGSTSLYYLPGQEALLENFTQYLNQKEREAFHLLKKEKTLSDEDLEPAIRVAIREIKDFAHPLTLSINNEQKLFWKYFPILDNEAKNLILNPGKSQEVKQKQKEIIKTREIPKSQSHLEPEIKEPFKKPEKAKKEKAPSAQEFKFSQNIRDYLTAKEIEILSIIEEKKKDFTAKVRIDTLFGKQEYLLIAKDKKKISEDDLLIALHKAQLEKALALVMAPGELDKNALETVKIWKNLIKFEKLKF